MPRSRVTLRDVAAHAGVSHQTVSRVINKSQDVHPDTRSKVEEAIQALGYRPNAIARFMAKGRTKTLLCLAPNLTDFTFAAIIEGAQQTARQQGYFLYTVSVPTLNEFGAVLDQMVASGRTEGLMVINSHSDERHQHLPKDFPTVLIGSYARDDEQITVALDERDGGRMATEHLLSLGHRRIAMIKGPNTEDCVEGRTLGFEDAIRSGNISVPLAMVLQGDWSATAGYQAVQRLLDEKLLFTAIFAQNDRMAVGAIQALRQAGLSVPNDVSVIGFDDMPLASYFDPPLTTIRQAPHLVGSAATECLVQAVENKPFESKNVLIPVELVLRRSTLPITV